MTMFWETRWGRGTQLVLTLIAGMVIASVGNSYLDFEKDSRAAIEKDYDNLKSSMVEFEQLLKEYAQKAKTGENVSSDTQSKFQGNLIKLYVQANELGKRDSKVKPVVVQYSDALARLDDATKKLDGPLDAHQFVEALSAYLHARGELETRVSEGQNRFFATYFDFL
jgi:uncharacterized coiled-coil DUF342 family protein